MPNLNRFIIATTSKNLPIWTKSDSTHPASMTCEVVQSPPRTDLQSLDSRVRTATGEYLPIWTKSNGTHPASMTREGAKFLSRTDLPNFDKLVSAATS